MVGLGLLWLSTLLGNSFHEDEAIYGAWSLAILRGDPWLWQTPVDKPPLTFYPIALSVALFGRHEWAARLPNLLWTLLLLIVVWRIARQRERPGWLALSFALLSPLLWALAASAFTDPAMVALSFLAVERAMQAQPGQAGVAFALALLAKPTALFLLPLLLFSLLFHSTAALPRFILACAAPLLLAWAWDASRAASSWWVLGTQAYGTLGQASGRWSSWATIVTHSLGWLLLLGGLAALSRVRARPFERPQPWTLLLALMLVGWVPLHILLGMQPWERYLLPLIPIAALLWTEISPVQAMGIPALWLAPPLVGRLRQPLRFQRPKLLSELPPALNRTTRVAYPPRRLYGLGALLGLFLLLIPAFVTHYQLEPHDGAWKGMAEMGAVIEALPGKATVFYLDSGRPLAWYAANARARLFWGGSDAASLREALAQHSASPRYLLLSRASLAARPGGWKVATETENFVLLTEPFPEERH
ncbi:MAG: glycosyltransferase family 39 protein [Ardenticatenales bacterium]|nr:glycosyltransferase family 39 protein [Ardenticatenales bacterium]